MRKTLYLKFVLGYLIFGFFGFLVVATFVSSMTLEHLKREKADSLYKEATLIANTYASDLYSSNVSLEEVKKQLNALSTYLSSQIWIINPSGRIIMTTETPLDVEHESRVENFDSTITAGSFYTVGDFFGCFQQEMLSVFAPITSNFKVQGYVVIHIPMADIRASSESLLNISYIMLVIFFLLSLIILIFFTEMVYLPLRKITAATEQYAAGNLHYAFQVDSEDEIGYLAASLSLMASEIARAEDNQKKFIANVSHDFRSPLTSIKGYLEAMLDGTIPPELHEKYLGIVLNETERLTKLTNSLLTLNNLNMKGMILEKSVFDLNSVIRSTAASFEGTCQQKHIGIELLLTGDRMPVLADKSKIEQVLYNLLDNAIKFSHPDSAIRIETNEKHGKVFVSVKDSGIGIPKDSLRLIFDRFYKTDLSRGKDKKGTGLGLSIAQSIVSMMDGSIQVESEVNKGSKFTVTIFLKLPEESCRNNMIKKEKSGNNTYDTNNALYEENYKIYEGKNVLLVEDNERNAEVAAELIGITGVNVELAENGRAAVARYEQHEPGYYKLIFMDIQLPVMNGYEAARKIRSSGREDAESIPIIAMTANAFTEDVEAAYAAGMNEHIAKPLEFERLTGILKKWLG